MMYNFTYSKKYRQNFLLISFNNNNHTDLIINLVESKVQARHVKRVKLSKSRVINKQERSADITLLNKTDEEEN